MKTTIFNVLCFLLTFPLTAQIFTDDRPCNLVDADNTNKKVCVREAPIGNGNAANIKQVLQDAGIPQLVLDSRLVNGVFANNIADLPAVKETAASLNNRPATYTGAGTVITQSNLEAQRAAIAANGGTFIFRGDVIVDAISKFIQVGSNTTIWIDGNVTYTGPQPEGTTPDQYSVSDVINGIFEVRGVNHGNRKTNVKFFGTKRGKIVTNGRCAGIFTHFVRNLTVSDINFERCRNVLFINVADDSELSGNFIYKSERRAIHLKATNRVRVTKNLIFEEKVDGIDVDAFAKNSTVDKNVICHTGDRFMIWTEIAVEDNLIDQNVAMFLPNADRRTLGFQENGSETSQPPTKNNTYSNNHVFYADINKGNRGFVLNPTRRIVRESIVFKNNYVWQSVTQRLPYEDPKPNVSDDVYYYLPRSGTTPPVADCSVAPTGFTFSNSADTTVTFTFDNTATDTRTFELRAYAKGTFTGALSGAVSFASAAAGATTITSANLEAGTEYDFVFRALCPGQTPPGSPLVEVSATTDGGTLGTDEFIENNRISIFPNPTNGLIQLQGISGLDIISVTDLLGRSVMPDIKLKETNMQIDISELAQGVYLIINRTNNKKLRIIKN